MKYDTIRQNVVSTPDTWFSAMMNGGASANNTSYYVSKRIMDLSICGLVLVIILPILLACVVAIKIECPSASVVYRQQRTGYMGKSFTMYKFRTMVPNADKLKEDLRKNSELAWPDFKIKEDPRITRLGHFLRKYSIDELPQLFNVIKGDMSLVGPRPTSFAPSVYNSWQRERLNVPPGITGLVQVINRDGMEFEERVRYDVAYVRNCCLWLDLLILYRTFWAIARGH